MATHQDQARGCYLTATATPSRKSRPRTKAELETRLQQLTGLMLGLRSQIRAKYDAAQTTDENTRHWANADGLSARAALDPAIRRTLRIRSRYEVANSPLARSILRKLGEYVVGTGPSLRLTTKDRDFNAAVQTAFTEHSTAIGLPAKLRLMRREKAQNGEAFGVVFINPPLGAPVKLDLRTVEADRVANPRMTMETQHNSDGIIFDDFGNPMGYMILRAHPGDVFWLAPITEADTFRADQVFHYFEQDRSDQTRGVPEITSALPYFAMRRRYVLAVLAAAETAADLAGVIRTQSPVPDSDDDNAPTPWDAIEIERRMLLTLPENYDISQLKAEQPTSTIEMFDSVITREIARSVNMPFGIAASDHSNYNFASGKLDDQPHQRTVAIEQDTLEDAVIEPFFKTWYFMAVRSPGMLPSPPDGRDVLPAHQWFWDGQDFLDPREASAKDISLKNGSDTHTRIYAKRGLDPLAEWEAEAELLGMTLDQYREKIIGAMFAQPQQQAGAAAGGGGNA